MKWPKMNLSRRATPRKDPHLTYKDAVEVLKAGKVSKGPQAPVKFERTLTFALEQSQLPRIDTRTVGAAAAGGGGDGGDGDGGDTGGGSSGSGDGGGGGGGGGDGGGSVSASGSGSAGELPASDKQMVIYGSASEPPASDRRIVVFGDDDLKDWTAHVEEVAQQTENHRVLKADRPQPTGDIQSAVSNAVSPVALVDLMVRGIAGKHKTLATRELDALQMYVDGSIQSEALMFDVDGLHEYTKCPKETCADALQACDGDMHAAAAVLLLDVSELEERLNDDNKAEEPEVMDAEQEMPAVLPARKRKREVGKGQGEAGAKHNVSHPYDGNFAEREDAEDADAEGEGASESD